MQDSPSSSARPATPPPPPSPLPSFAVFATARDDRDGSVGRPPSTPGGSVPSPLSLTMSMSNRSMSIGLHQLGIPMASPLLPLRRQFSLGTVGTTQEEAILREEEDENESYSENSEPSSPTDSLADSSHSSHGASAASHGLADDSRDVLVDRLNDLVRHLTAHAGYRLGYDEEVLSTLHARVDEMESVLAVAGEGHRHRHRRRGEKEREGEKERKEKQEKQKEQEQKEQEQKEQEQKEQEQKEQKEQDNHKQSPTLSPGSPQQSDPLHPQHPHSKPPEPTVPKEVTVACEELSNDLTGVLASLNQRSEELEHIQNIMLSQLATANDRVEELAAEVAFLRLQLRGIEVRCRAYMPPNADPELAASIENWKSDWTALQHKVAQERTLEDGGM